MNSKSFFLKKALFLGPIINIVLTHPLRSESAKDPGEFSIPRTVPLYPQQRARLQNLVTENDEAAILFQERKAKATPLLNQKPIPRGLLEKGIRNPDDIEPHKRAVEGVKRDVEMMIELAERLLLEIERIHMQIAQQE